MKVRFFNLKGRLVQKNIRLIDWEKKCRSNIQFQVKRFLKPYWVGHICAEEMPCFGTLLKIDFVNLTLKIAIEVQGQQHGEFHYFHGGEPQKYLDSIKRDVIKATWLDKNEFKLVEINYDEIDKLSKKFFLEKFGVEL